MRIDYNNVHNLWQINLIIYYYSVSPSTCNILLEYYVATACKSMNINSNAEQS